MKKILFCAYLIIGVSTICSAQLSSRQNDSTEYRIGTRPVKGTKVLSFGVRLGNEWTNPLNMLRKGDLLTGKYFLTDYLAVRGAFRIAHEIDRSNGIIDTMITGGALMENYLRRSTSHYIFAPGVEKHFSYSNIFDVYTGGDLYLGLGRETVREDYDYVGGFYSRRMATTPNTILGFGGVVGVNFFILDLPLSIGVEYGWTALWNLGGKTTVNENINDALGERSLTYYTQATDAFDNPDANAYVSLTKRAVNIDTNNNIRFTLNLYFK